MILPFQRWGGGLPKGIKLETELRMAPGPLFPCCSYFPLAGAMEGQMRLDSVPRASVGMPRRVGSLRVRPGAKGPTPRIQCWWVPWLTGGPSTVRALVPSFSESASSWSPEVFLDLPRPC